MEELGLFELVVAVATAVLTWFTKTFVDRRRNGS